MLHKKIALHGRLMALAVAAIFATNDVAVSNVYPWPDDV